VSQKLARRAGALLERRSSRRRFLSRLAIGGAAFSVAPIRYLVRPEPALALVRRPGNCGRGRCARDGFTEFCCSIRGGRNVCPSRTFVGGWWKCTSYNGGLICADRGVRYYIDCNRRPGQDCSCKCGDNQCDCRRVCCNVFRYGQCNTHIGGVTEVVCRVVSCQRPWRVDEYNCNSSYAQDNNTCSHEACCRCGDCKGDANLAEQLSTTAAG
jgi:hypothetical protein